MRRVVLYIGIVILLAGCTSPRQMALLQGDQSTTALVEKPSFRIAQGDRLQITFSAQNPEAVAPYNSAGISYHVNNTGEVSLPAIGTVRLEGLTMQQAQDTLQSIVRTQVRDALVHVEVANAMVTILGEVNRPAAVQILQPITLLEALGQVGGLTRNANCKAVLVQRVENDQVQRYYVNLLSTELYASPCYYIQKGDVIVVSPLHAVSTR